jgi:hypothetical protein
MNKRTIILPAVLIAITTGSPPSYPEQEKAVPTDTITLTKDQLDRVTAGQYINCRPTSGQTFMCRNEPTPLPGGTCRPVGRVTVCQ